MFGRRYCSRVGNLCLLPARARSRYGAARLFRVATGWSHMAAVNLIGSYNYGLVALSVLIAIFASYAALDLAGRVTAARGWTRAIWLLAGAGAMGTGIWSMHYIGMLAFILPIPVAYHWPTVLLSLFAAIFASVIALYVGSRQKMGAFRALAGSVPMGGGIAVMHYTGMAAASFTPSSLPSDLSRAISISTLGTIGIAAVTWIVLGLALLTSWLDRRFAAQKLELQEEKLQRSEAYLAEAQRLTHTGSWAWRVPGGGAVHLSEEWYRIYGFDPENGPPAFEEYRQRTHPEDRAKWQGAVDRAIAEKSEYEVEFRTLLPDGSVKHIRTVGHPVLNASGDLVQFVGSSTDITERKRAEQATLLLAAIVESSHDAIVSKRLNGVITSWNKGAERLLRGERVDHFETVRMRKDGSMLDVALTISPMKDAAGAIVGASKLARDITERKRAEAALRQAQADLAYMSRVTTMGELTASL